MATQTTVKMVDDLDGGKRDVRTVNFSLDGVDYEIDLSSKNATALGKLLAPWISAGRQSSGGAKNVETPRRRGSGKAAPAAPSLTDVRAWAISQGLTIAARGRVARTVIDAYNAAH